MRTENDSDEMDSVTVTRCGPEQPECYQSGKNWAVVFKV
jgi:hypothetical protein